MAQNLDPIRLLYPPRDRVYNYIQEKEALGEVSVPLARALGYLCGNMEFHGKTDEEILERFEHIFGE